jgi:hypothetical protein
MHPVTPAYIDPGSGALLLQLLTAAFLGASYYVFRAWKRIRAFFSSLFSAKAGTSETSQSGGQ